MKNTGTLIERLQRMGENPRKIATIRNRIAFIAQRVAGASSLEEAIGKGFENDSVSMNIRRLHNYFGCHSNVLCRGALYRSMGVIEAQERGLLTSKVVHCEHTIPVNVVAGILYNRFRHASLHEIAEFLIRGSVVTAAVRNVPVFADQEEASRYVVEGSSACLSRERSYGGPSKAWKHEHPEYDHESLPALASSRPFLRYAGTGIRVRSMIDGKDVDLERFALADHWRNMDGLVLFDAGTYFAPERIAA